MTAPRTVPSTRARLSLRQNCKSQWSSCPEIPSRAVELCDRFSGHGFAQKLIAVVGKNKHFPLQRQQSNTVLHANSIRAIGPDSPQWISDGTILFSDSQSTPNRHQFLTHERGEINQRLAPRSLDPPLRTLRAPIHP